MLELNTDRAYNRLQVQNIIGCGKTKFWDLVSRGEFPNAFKVGREVRVPGEDLKNFVKRAIVG